MQVISPNPSLDFEDHIRELFEKPKDKEREKIMQIMKFKKKPKKTDKKKDKKVKKGKK